MHDSKKGFIKFLVSTVNTGKSLHTIIFNLLFPLSPPSFLYISLIYQFDMVDCDS